MEIVVSMGLLVAFLGWMVSVYNRLHHLRSEVQGAWQQWVQATHHRNERLTDFAEVFALVMPEHDSALHRLRRLTDDSEQILRSLREPRWGTPEADSLPGVEWRVQRAVHESVAEVESEPAALHHEQLQQLCGLMSVALYQQDHRTRLFNRAAREYNAALVSPGGRMLSSVFGFLPAGALEAPDLRCSDTSGLTGIMPDE